LSNVKKIATLGFGTGINILVNFLFLPYMARVLSYEDYGSYSQVLLITTFAASLLSFGLPQIIYVYLNKHNNEKEVLSTNIFSAFVLGTIGTIALIISSQLFGNWFKNDQLGDLIPIYAITLIFSLPFQSINAFFIYKNKVKLSAGIAILTNLIKIALVIGSIQLYNSVYLALFSIFISQLLQFVIGFLAVKNSLTLNLKKTLIITQLKKGFPLGLTGILGAGILYIDGIMVSKLEGVQAFAIYRNGAIEVPFISTIYGSIAAIILPEVARLYKESNFKEIVNLKRKVIMNTMMLTYPVLVFLLFNSRDLIVLYLGQKYEASAIIFAIFNLTLLIRVNDYHDILIAANKTKYILYFYSVVFLLNLILNYFFINLWGSVGAAYATIISLLIFSFLHLYKSAKTIQASIKDFVNLKNLILLLFISISVATILNLSISYFVKNEVRLVLFMTLFFPIVYLLLVKFNLISKEIITQLIPKRYRK
jgi:O-antigen/teichoic acid export membrane protein